MDRPDNSSGPMDDLEDDIASVPDKVGDMMEMGGLLGSAPVMPVHRESSAAFINRGGRIPAPLHSLRN